MPNETQAPRNRATGRPIIPPRLHHTTFTTLRLDEMVAWYEKVAGLCPSSTAMARPGFRTTRPTTGSRCSRLPG